MRLLNDTTFTPDNWATLRVFLIYRIFLAALLVLVFFGTHQGVLGDDVPRLFSITAQFYLGVTLASFMFAMAKPEQRASNAMLAVFLDIVAITLMMHASGGVQSGLGMLMAISIALGSMSLAGQAPLLLAALASLAVLTEQIYAHSTQSFDISSYTQSGLLGVSFFALAILAHQLTSRARASEKLADQREHDLANLAQLNDYVIQHMQAGIVVIDDEQIIQLMNESAWVLLGMPDAMRHHPLEQASAKLAAQYRAWLRAPGRPRPSFRPVTGGRDLRAQFTRLGEPRQHGTLILLEDTAVLTAQAQQMKLASLGRLTAGIAHEIRNPLGAISHAAQLLEESPDLPPTDQRMIDIIEANSKRVNEVVENILKLSRQDAPHPKPLALKQWLEEVISELAETHRLAGHQVLVHVDPEGTTVFADPGQLRQILEVLTDNANKHFDREGDALVLRFIAGITTESGGPFIEIQDNGDGIPAEDVGKLFEPFFTTRHQGTGLGLYIARQLSEANRIRLEYIPLPTGGSGFRLSFPNPRRQQKTL